MNPKALKIAISGASGFVGGNLIKRFKALGWSSVGIERSDFEMGKARVSQLLLEADAVINLAGAPIFARWTEPYKKVLIDSRVKTTRMLVESISEMENKPSVFISTSAVGIYGQKGIHTERDCAYADDFLGVLTRQWEAEAMMASSIGIRTIIFRFGIILGDNGGALQQMLPVFKRGLGGVVGSGSQAFSWIHIDDLTSSYVRALTDKGMEGVYNLTAPTTSTNREFTKSLASALNKPAFLSVPAFALKLRYGEGAQVLLSGQSVLPERLLESGFVFKFPDLKSALEDIVRKT